MGYGRNNLGVTPLIAVVGSGTAATTFGMATINNCASFRFLTNSTETRDVKSVYVHWGAITAAGTVRVRIETDSSGKASGTLYDANATVDITPTLGWQVCTFATLPTTGLSANTLYHIVLLTTGTGTTQTLRQSFAPAGGAYPSNALTATDGSTRTNLAESSSTVPIATIVFEDDSEEAYGLCPFAGSVNFTVYGTRSAGLKFTVPTGPSIKVSGMTMEGILRNGTPDNIIFRILDSSSAVVSGATITIDKNALTNASGKRLVGRFASDITLAPGTYRAVIEQSGHTSTSGNNWQLYSATYRSTATAPSYLKTTTTTDITAGSPTWTDTDDVPLVGLQLNDITASSTGGAIIIGG